MRVAFHDRLTGAVVGAAVADAACQTLHWNYDLDKLAGKLQRQNKTAAPEFYPQLEAGTEDHGNPFYSLPAGKQTCYGDQSHVLLQSIVAAGGVFDAQRFADSVAAFFAFDAAGSDYPPAGAPPPPKDVQLRGGWRHASVKGLLQNVAEGKTAFGVCGSADEQVDGVAKVAPLVAALAGTVSPSELAAQVARAVRVVQNTDVAAENAAAAARILELVLVGDATAASADADDADASLCITDAIRLAIDSMRSSADARQQALGAALDAAVSKAETPHADVVGELGRS